MNPSKRWLAALSAGGLVLAVLIGCGREESVASKSAAAFREAQKRGVTFEGEGHAHGHEAAVPGHEHAPPEAAARGEEAAPGHVHGAAKETPAEGAMGHAGEHGGHAGMAHGARPSAPREHGGHAALGHAQSPAAPGGHAGHGTMAGQAPPAPSVPAPVAVPSGQPAATLRPDPLDAPAATSQTDAQRSAAMAREMAGGHGAHGAGNYRQVDAGRAPDPRKEGEKKDEHEEHQHDPPEGRPR